MTALSPSFMLSQSTLFQTIRVRVISELYYKSKCSDNPAMFSTAVVYIVIVIVVIIVTITITNDPQAAVSRDLMQIVSDP